MVELLSCTISQNAYEYFTHKFNSIGGGAELVLVPDPTPQHQTVHAGDVRSPYPPDVVNGGIFGFGCSLYGKHPFWMNVMIRNIQKWTIVGHQ